MLSSKTRTGNSIAEGIGTLTSDLTSRSAITLPCSSSSVSCTSSMSASSSDCRICRIWPYSPPNWIVTDEDESTFPSANTTTGMFDTRSVRRFARWVEREPCADFAMLLMAGASSAPHRSSTMQALPVLHASQYQASWITGRGMKKLKSTIGETAYRTYVPARSPPQGTLTGPTYRTRSATVRTEAEGGTVTSMSYPADEGFTERTEHAPPSHTKSVPKETWMSRADEMSGKFINEMIAVPSGVPVSPLSDAPVGATIATGVSKHSKTNVAITGTVALKMTTPSMSSDLVIPSGVVTRNCVSDNSSVPTEDTIAVTVAARPSKVTVRSPGVFTSCPKPCAVTRIESPPAHGASIGTGAAGGVVNVTSNPIRGPSATRTSPPLPELGARSWK
mmetsp:Transcript_39388/g.93250  ORF Transcript_39388/g.93250 Transcript_39388/m.93250 type:complete len:391 (+) Transcript_39388:5477-6649(+)